MVRRMAGTTPSTKTGTTLNIASEGKSLMISEISKIKFYFILIDQNMIEL